MQLTEKNLMVGDWVQYYAGEGFTGWDVTRIDWQDLKSAALDNEAFNKETKPILLTENVLKEIEGVRYDEKQKGYFVSPDLMVRVIPANEGRIIYDVHYFQYSYEETNCICIVDEYEYHLHQLQQLSRCLGHELVINF